MLINEESMRCLITREIKIFIIIFDEFFDNFAVFIDICYTVFVSDIWQQNTYNDHTGRTNDY